MRLKEFYWLIGTILLAFIVDFLFFGTDVFDPDATFDINVHDTYFVITNVHFVLLIFIVVIFVVYLARTIRRSFKNLTANLILMIATILLILVFIGLGSTTDAFMRESPGWTIYPLTGSKEITSEITAVQNDLKILSNVILMTQVLLMILLAFCGFKTGQFYKRIDKNS